MDRRAFLTTVAAGSLALAGCTGSSSTPASSGSGSSGGSGTDDAYDGWFEGVDNYDGTVDRTGESEVVVKVGTQANGGGFGFGPAAVEVSVGTTVVWEWTGAGGSHNVVAEDGSFGSQYASQQGATFEHSFEETGTYPYYCQPHINLGMKGAVRVVES
ncbi:halocyanin domain-containing protein [Halogranum gelatinilyticum]|uniref:Halocyanin domain-containing protein n=1 Tax=Halogranum gelatinilyticum TaxID=660521 RepID=A0A1G9QAY1_9EURY|nr:halocyanin domain-containing protein [Halogranum gelatinilyticum]SDM08119.1 halocyanin domain-containing protein [Halogranum gelatinilyticum]